LFPLTAEQVHAPFGVEVAQVTPSAVAIEFEPSASRLVSVVPSVDGRPAPGYVVGKVTANPPRVEVVGPDSAVKRVTEALTEPVSVHDARSRVQEVVTAGTVDPSLRLKNPRGITVTVQILPAPLERTLRNRPLHLRNLGPNLTAAAVPESVDVAVRGDRDTLAHVVADEIVAFVDVSGLGVGEYMLSVHADNSQNVGVSRIDPANVQVRITSVKD
jgi:YbbR domain-containing protein